MSKSERKRWKPTLQMWNDNFVDATELDVIRRVLSALKPGVRVRFDFKMQFEPIPTAKPIAEAPHSEQEDDCA